MTAEVVVYGSSPAALTAAIEAQRHGKSAVIVCPETRIGGLTTDGLDSVAKDSMWTFEPSAALAILERWERQNRLKIFRGEFLDRKSGVVKDGARIGAIKTLSGKVFRGSMFVDATYEGDLMAAAGVSYMVGREANAVYGETIRGTIR